MLIVPLKNGRFLLQIQHEYPWIKLNMNQDTQCRAVRYIFNDYNFTSSVSSMLNQLALPTLEKRRKIASLSMFYKINHGLVRIKFPDYIKPTSELELINTYTEASTTPNIHHHHYHHSRIISSTIALKFC